MQDLKNQEIFEIEVLDRLNTAKMLNRIVFTGGTMLRLCFGLDRFSVDLDFWIVKELNSPLFFNNLKDLFSQYYTITDSANKRNTILFELRSPAFHRSLKIEIRKELKQVKINTGIAYSKFSNKQVLVKHVSIDDMMNAKIQAFLNRNEIRDVYDIEFLFKRGCKISASDSVLKELLIKIESLNKNDYSVKLGSLLEPALRKYYREQNFTILKMHLVSRLNS